MQLESLRGRFLGSSYDNALIILASRIFPRASATATAQAKGDDAHSTDTVYPDRVRHTYRRWILIALGGALAYVM